uniref:Anti-proliferative protein domain-containing protein n=1 Tax=Arion vulgaris TaxID=1028688 RepID=A0A0B6ZVR2_9EUPU
MQKEIKKAVEVFHRIAFGTKNNVQKIPEKKLAEFVSVLTELLTARYAKIWYPENPDKGSGYRCIRVNNQSVDPTVVESLKRAKIVLSKDLIITELTIWVDPGIVSFRIGEDGSVGSEVVDEEVYNLGKQTKENTLKRSGFESDEGFSSRSSSPETSMSESSQSACSSKSASPVPSKYSPVPPTMEFNPYSPPIHISYPSLYQRPTTPLSQQPRRNTSPITNQLQPHTIRSQSRPVIHFGPTMMSTSNRDLFSQQSFIPASAAHRVTSYSGPQTVFSNQDHINTYGTSHDGIEKMTFNPYHTMPMMYGGSLQQTNFYDIPVVA